MVLVRSERPGRPSSSHDATASATVYVRDDLGARPSSSRSSAMASTTAVFVEPVTLRRIRLPSAANPRLTEPLHLPMQCRWNLASVQPVPILCSKLTPRIDATPRNLHLRAAPVGPDWPQS